MALVRIALNGYRCFAQRQDVELRPVTVVLGRNNSGKSALARAALVCRTGFVTDSPAPLDLDVLDPNLIESFTDLIYANRPHGNMTVEFSFADQSGEFHLAATIQNITEFQTQVVSRFELESDDFSAKFEWQPSDPNSVGRYTVTGDGAEKRDVPTVFMGLMPIDFLDGSLSGQFERHMTDLVTRARANYPTVRYFGPFRDRPERRYRLPGRMPQDVGNNGQDAAGVLISDFARQGGKLLTAVNHELEQSMPGWTVDVVERGGLYSVVLKSIHDDSINVNIADTGTGVAQVLPIFVQRAVDATKKRDQQSVLEIIEQPELHLHPAAHAALADLYLRAAQKTPVRFMIETHSETFVLRLRRRIAEGLDPSNVALYFVENDRGSAYIRHINVHQDGSLDYWPEGVFSEDYTETQALTRAQLSRGANAS